MPRCGPCGAEARSGCCPTRPTRVGGCHLRWQLARSWPGRAGRDASPSRPALEYAQPWLCRGGWRLCLGLLGCRAGCAQRLGRGAAGCRRLGGLHLLGRCAFGGSRLGFSANLRCSRLAVAVLAVAVLAGGGGGSAALAADFLGAGVPTAFAAAFFDAAFFGAAFAGSALTGSAFSGAAFADVAFAGVGAALGAAFFGAAFAGAGAAGSAAVWASGAAALGAAFLAGAFLAGAWSAPFALGAALVARTAMACARGRFVVLSSLMMEAFLNRVASRTLGRGGAARLRVGIPARPAPGIRGGTPGHSPTLRIQDMPSASAVTQQHSICQ